MRLLGIRLSAPFFVFDFSSSNRELDNVDISNPEEFGGYIQRKLKENSAEFGIGKYNENRTIYSHSRLFEGEVPRTVHLGIDFWVKAGTKVFCLIDGVVHSLRNNEGEGDYGPTIIIEHNVGGKRFFTLYGHLSVGSLGMIKQGQAVNAGDEIGRVGNFPENGNWPSHLHFQVINDMLGNEGDFPGVASIENRQRMLEICPDPNLMLCLNLPTNQ